MNDIQILESLLKSLEFLRMLCWIGVAVAIFLTVFSPVTYSKPRHKFDRYYLLMIIGGGLLLALAFVIFLFDYVWLSGFLVLIGMVLLVGTLYELLPQAFDGFFRFGLPLVALLILGVWLTVEPERELRWRIIDYESQEAAVAQILNDAKQKWQPADGVSEVTEGSLIYWLAVEPRIDVDWEYEQELGTSASREIPISFHLLNNTFEEVLVASDNNMGPLWHMEIEEKSSGQTIAQWDARNQPELLFMNPAERRTFQILWNGRNAAGQLVPPGEYEVYVRVAERSTISTLDLSRVFLIVSAGPVVEVTPDPSEQVIRDMAENIRIGKQMDDMIRQYEHQRMLDWQFQNFQRNMSLYGR